MKSVKYEHKNLQIVMNKEVREIGPSPRLEYSDTEHNLKNQKQIEQ